ncbi:hypothetical protein HD596_001329 [Nonomuraea jabiensis]|uniref:Uncharacterized protein n=1 Tax=Nonomuraea jabiensis TaxID=882448 RepID=A0A7W9FZT3_9ACTN|nr:hypothetical protein [Nonomuraea jabiensis]
MGHQVMNLLPQDGAAVTPVTSTPGKAEPLTAQ